MHPLEVRVPEFLDAHPEWLREAQAYLQSCYPQEGCGIFVATGFKPIANVHTDPEHAFEMHPDVLIEHDVLAVLHSHPDGNRFPSAADMRQQIATAVPWGISVCTPDWCGDPVWFGDEMPRAPLIGRPFIHGVFDCYSLIRDWYAQERDLDLLDFPRDWDWWSTGQNLYEDGFREAGFEEIDAATEELRPGDVFFLKLRSDVVNHGGVYVGDGSILHHAQFALSRRSDFTLWAPKIVKWIRYRG